MEHVEHYAWVGSSHQTDPSVSISPTLFFHQHKPSVRPERLFCIPPYIFYLLENTELNWKFYVLESSI